MALSGMKLRFIKAEWCKPLSTQPLVVTAAAMVVDFLPWKTSRRTMLKWVAMMAIVRTSENVCVHALNQRFKRLNLARSQVQKPQLSCTDKGAMELQ